MTNHTELATFGGGCFWCIEAIIQRLKGVHSVASGYAGGHVENPSYRAVCAGTTGHAEVIQVRFDPEAITYEELLTVFMTTHDPTTLNRQGADVGTQYRSIILYHDDQQKATAEKVLEKVKAYYEDSIVTEIVPIDTFYVAEDHHQNYYNDNPNAGYCRVVINPKIQKLQQMYLDRLKLEEA